MTDQTSDAPDAVEATSDVELISAERMVFFSDAVVAIAITLLALILPVPPHLTSKTSNVQTLKDIWAYRDAYLAFLISFAVIANHWRSHHRLYRDVARLDRRIISINMFWLLLIVITPFATRLIAGTGGFGARFAIYAFIQVLIILTFLAMGRHIRGSQLLRRGAPEPFSRVDRLALLAVAGMFALSVPVALATNSEWAFAIWVASVFAARSVRRFYSRNRSSATQEERT